MAILTGTLKNILTSEWLTEQAILAEEGGLAPQIFDLKYLILSKKINCPLLHLWFVDPQVKYMILVYVHCPNKLLDLWGFDLQERIIRGF